MIVAAIIAGFLIISLLLETISSPPRDEENESTDVTIAPQ